MELRKRRGFKRSMYAFTVSLVGGLCFAVAEISPQQVSPDSMQMLQGSLQDCPTCSQGPTQYLISQAPLSKSEEVPIDQNLFAHINGQFNSQTVSLRRGINADPISDFMSNQHAYLSPGPSFQEQFNAYQASQPSIFGNVVWPQPKPDPFAVRAIFGASNLGAPYVNSYENASRAFFHSMSSAYSFIQPPFMSMFPMPAPM